MYFNRHSLVLAPDHLANAGLPFALHVLSHAPVLAAGLLGSPALPAQTLHHLLFTHLLMSTCQQSEVYALNKRRICAGAKDTSLQAAQA